MAFRYINPGYVSLLDSDCIATELIDSTYSKTGVAFRQTSGGKGITIPNFAQGDEFWAKFDWYLPSTTYNFLLRCSAPTTNKYGLYIFTQNEIDCRVMAGYPSGNTSNDFATTWSDSGLKRGAINRILFHLVFGDAATAYMECTINNVQLPRSTGRAISWKAGYTSSAPLTKVAELYSNDGATAISNVILSDQEISIREDVVALPITATDTDMTGENGLYIADAANQSLLQSVNAATLGAIHGANSPVTGVALVGNPAYKITKGEASLMSLSKTGDIVTEHDSFSLSDDTESVIQSCRTLSNTTIADLQNMQFGWKAGA